MGHSLNRTGFRINQNLVVDDGTFNPGYILVSDLNGLAKWKDPAQYITNDEPLDRFIGELYGGGIVVAVWREQKEQLYEYSLIASVKNYSEPYSDGEYFYFQWSNIANLAIGATARSNTFGASNSNAIIGQGSPLAAGNPFDKAASKCAGYVNEDLYGLGIYGDWHLPSTFEINCLANNAAIVDRVISQYATDKSLSLIYNASTGAFSNMDLFENANSLGYWTSTEYNAGSAYYLNMAGGGVKFATASKNSFKFVRPFRMDSKRWNGISWVQDRNKTGKILITYDQDFIERVNLTTQMISNITKVETSLGNTVSVIAGYTNLPTNLSQYDHIWDIGLEVNQDQSLLVPTGAAAKYTTYLQNGGGMFMMGENSGFNTRNNDLASFISGLGGGSVTSDGPTTTDILNISSEFLIANNTSTVQLDAGGCFTSIGNGTPIVTNSIDGSTGYATVWKTGSLSLATKGAIVVVLDINFLSSYYNSGNSAQFVANISQILNKS